MFNRRFTHIALLFILAFFTALLTGCSGGDSAAPQTRKGQVQLHIEWPSQNRSASSKYIPIYASSILFELSPKGTPSQIVSLVVNRPSSLPSSQDVMIQQLLPAGIYELAGAARALADAQGATVASGAVEVNVQPGINPVALTLNSNVKTLQILGQPLNIGVGQTITLQSGAFDPDNNGLLLPDGALTWSIVTGGSSGTITTRGALTATAPGTIRVRVAEPVTGVKAEADVVISVQTVSAGLAKSGYPKPGADGGSTGLVSGSGAGGQIAWSFDLGNRGLNTPVLGNNNLVFAVNQSGVVYAFDATLGTKKWQMTLPNLPVSTNGSLLTAYPAVSDDNTLYVGYAFGIQAYDAGTGLPKWTNPDYIVNGNITVDTGKLYVPTKDQGIAVLDIRTGAKIKTYPALQYTYDPAIANGILYFVTENFTVSPRGAKLCAVNLASGGTVFNLPIAANPNSSGYNGSFPVASSNGTVFIELGDGKISALDGLTGAVKFSQQNAIVAISNQQPAIGQDNSVYFTQHTTVVGNFGFNHVVRYSPGLDQSIWNVGPSLRQNTVGTDGTVYGTGQAPSTGVTNVYALNGADGTVKWNVPLTLGHPTSSTGFGEVPGYTAVGLNGMVYVVSADFLIYAIK